MEDDPKGPVDQRWDGALKAKIWRNHGESGAFYSTELSRTYSDRDGNLRDSYRFSGADLLKISKLADWAYERTDELKHEERRGRYGRDAEDAAPNRRDVFEARRGRESRSRQRTSRKR